MNEDGGNGTREQALRITSGSEYVESLRGRNLNVYLFGERVAEPVDHPMIRPSAKPSRNTLSASTSC